MNYILYALVILIAISVLRILLGPGLWDRLLGFNLVTSKLIMLIVLIASLRGESFLLDIALVYALLSFSGVIFFSVYLQRKGRY